MAFCCRPDRNNSIPFFCQIVQILAKKYPGFNPRSVETPEGLLIEYAYDVAVMLRDGVKMYTDIYRPAKQHSSTKVPIVIAWTPILFHSGTVDYRTENIILRQLRRFRSILVLMLQG
jgi:predicted acyl esterase